MRGATAAAVASLPFTALGAVPVDPSFDVELIEVEKEVEAAMLEWHRLLRIRNDLEEQFARLAPRPLLRSSFIEAMPPELAEEYRSLTVRDFIIAPYSSATA
jgi:hypothetical protein